MSLRSIVGIDCRRPFNGLVPNPNPVNMSKDRLEPYEKLVLQVKRKIAARGKR
jgi:hypothetical protein